MKIAISSTGKNLTDDVSDVFARCPYFIIAEVENGKIQNVEAIENKTASQLGRASVSAAQLILEKGIDAVITKNIGPRAIDVKIAIPADNEVSGGKEFPPDFL